MVAIAHPAPEVTPEALALVIPPKPYTLKGTACTVYLRPLPFGLLVKVRERTRTEEEDLGIYLEIFAHAVCDKSGRAIYGGLEPAEASKQISTLPFPIIREVVEQALELSAADVDAAKKN